MTATGPKNITQAMLKAALRKHAGVYVLAARELGCDRANVCQRVKRSPELQRFVAEIEEEVGDAAVAVIKRAIVGGDKQMARWYASTKLKHLGFTTRTEVTGKDGAPLPAAPVHVIVEYVDASPEPEDEDIPA